MYQGDVAALAWGLFCRDLVTAGWDYEHAVAYWDLEGRPARMDADANGIPCETVYPPGDVTAYWGDPLPTGLSPGPGSGWNPTDREAPVAPGCCSLNDNGPVSPPLPPESGAFPEDGAYSVTVTQREGQPDQLDLEIRRWLSCAENPDSCSPDLYPGDIYADPHDAVVRTVDLDASLIAVVLPIGHWVNETWTDLPSIEGDGTALLQLLRRYDAAATTIAIPLLDSAQQVDLTAMEEADPTFPYGPTPDDGSLLAYRGPESTFLTTNSWALTDPAQSGLYSWWCTLEIVAGNPVLYIWAGQIAG